MFHILSAYENALARARTRTHTECNIVLAKTDPRIYLSGPIVLSFE